MSANFRKIREEPPRAFDVISRDVARDKDPSRRTIPRGQLGKRLEPLVELIASGDVPMDNRSAQAVAAYLERRGSRG